MAAKPGTKSFKVLEYSFLGDLRNLKRLVAEFGGDGKGIARIKDKKGLSALHLAAGEGKLNVVKYLIQDLKFHVDLKSGNGDTPLHHASQGGHLSTAVYLLGKDANPDARNDLQYTPLHHAAYNGDTDFVLLLLSKGVNVDVTCEFGTPLNRAAGQGKPEVVKILLEHRANPNIFFNRVFTPLSSSIIGQSLACLELLIEGGADPNAGSCGFTPLLQAVDDDEKEMIQSLLKAGADPNMTNELGLTPIEVAAMKGNLEVVEILYPRTTPIATYLDWSIDGILTQINSEEAEEQRALKRMQVFGEMKMKGQEAFGEKDYLTAIFWYSKALELSVNPILLSNRSLCWARLKDGERCLEDAQTCVMLAPDWPKAHYREGVAWMLYEKFDEAANAFAKGLELEPENKELKKALQNAHTAKI
ncbi:dolichyl-diphosphooligosaccharide--protein glycotransferase [Ranunculus cassubicifolius]